MGVRKENFSGELLKKVLLYLFLKQHLENTKHLAKYKAMYM